MWTTQHFLYWKILSILWKKKGFFYVHRKLTSSGKRESRERLKSTVSFSHEFSAYVSINALAWLFLLLCYKSELHLKIKNWKKNIKKNSCTQKFVFPQNFSFWTWKSTNIFFIFLLIHINTFSLIFSWVIFLIPRSFYNHCSIKRPEILLFKDSKKIILLIFEK